MGLESDLAESEESAESEDSIELGIADDADDAASLGFVEDADRVIDMVAASEEELPLPEAVSYTHLTLPTNLRV